jgi:hypothetical protein
MSGDEIFWLIYAVTMPIIWYSLTAVCSTNAQLCFPKWQHFTYNATGASLVFGCIIALIPILNWMVFFMCLMFWILSSRNVSSWMSGHPLRK